MVLWFQKPDQPEPPDLDLAYLARLAGHIGEVETRELLADGMIDLSDRLDRLGELVQAGDRMRFAELAHDIAGAAGHLGLSRLSRTAVDAYRAVQNEAPELAIVLAPVEACREKALAALGDYCAGGAKAAVPEP